MGRTGGKANRRQNVTRLEGGTTKMASDQPTTVRVLTPLADPAPLGLAGFALTTFMLSARNAGIAPDIIWFPLAIFYGGLAQFIAGILEYRTRNVFGATAFASYGAFWMSLGLFFMLGKNVFKALPQNINQPAMLGWFLLAFAIFTFYMWVWSALENLGLFLIFGFLEAVLVVLIAYEFTGLKSLEIIGGWGGIFVSFGAWYASAAGVAEGITGRAILPMGSPLWEPGGAGAGEEVPSRA